MDQKQVGFSGHGGTELAGIFYLPEGEGPFPGLVMTHGFSAVKEMCLREFAEVFCEAGLAVLLYDHRNLGESAGEPRQEINPWARSGTIAMPSAGWGKGPKSMPIDWGSGEAVSVVERF